VVPTTVASRDGRELVLSGNIAEGNSGGPIVKDGAVMGLVTGTQGQYARATPAVIVRFTMEGWGVKLPAAGDAGGVGTRARPPAAGTRARVASPVPPPAATNSNARFPATTPGSCRE